MKYLLMILLVASFADAASIYTFQVSDINTREPLQNVTIRLDNRTNIFYGYTDINGLKEFTLNNGTHYYTMSKLGYLPYANTSTGNLGVGSVDSIIRYMTPISTEGIIRLKLSDMTGMNHPFCIYYTENNRLYNCYKTNETEEDIMLIVNTGYYIKPIIQPGDALLSSQNMRKTIPYMIEPLLPIAIVVIILGLLIGALWKRR